MRVPRAKLDDAAVEQFRQRVKEDRAVFKELLRAIVGDVREMLRPQHDQDLQRAIAESNIDSLRSFLEAAEQEVEQVDPNEDLDEDRGVAMVLAPP
jgi:hypothetical protein